MKIKDLKRANIDQASKVVILTDIVEDVGRVRESEKEEGNDEENGGDTVKYDCFNPYMEPQ